MQYNSLNAWGFIGYQLGEAVLISAGYYSPKQVTLDNETLDSFYIFMPDSTWANGAKQARSEIPGSGGNYILATDTNLWQGSFVGKNGVSSFADLKVPDKQEVVIRDVMRFNYGVMTELLTKANMTWAQALAKSWPGKDANGNNITIQATMSGLLAAAHLRGAWGTADLLIKNQQSCDELGTCITTYIHKFGGFDTIFDTPANDVISGSPYNEVLAAGWGNDVVETGGGKDLIQLNQSTNARTLVKGFTVGDDRVVLRGWSVANPLANLVVTQGIQGAELSFAGQTLCWKMSQSRRCRLMSALSFRPGRFIRWPGVAKPQSTALTRKPTKSAALPALILNTSKPSRTMAVCLSAHKPQTVAFIPGLNSKASIAARSAPTCLWM